MNAADDKEKKDPTPSSSNTGSNSNYNNGYSSNSNSGMFNKCLESNDCGRILHSNSLVCNGARPKTQPLACNIPNGVTHNNYSLKLNNNVSVIESDKMHNGNGMDLYLRNNVDYCVPVEKCPPKVRKQINGSYSNSRPCKNDIEDSLSENEEEDEYCIYTYKGDKNQLADLPSSFFRLGVIPPGRENNEGRSSSPDMDYLEMDFDPGPSNGRDDSSEDSDCCDMQHNEDRPVDDELRDEEPVGPLVRSPSPSRSPTELTNENKYENSDVHSIEQDNAAVCSCENKKPDFQNEENDENNYCVDSDDEELNSCDQSVVLFTFFAEPKNDLNATGKSPLNVQPSTSSYQSQSSQPDCFSIPSASISRDTWGYHCSSGDLCSPGDLSDNNTEGWDDSYINFFGSQDDNSFDSRKFNLRSALYHRIMAKRLVLDKQASFPDSDQSNLDDKQFQDSKNDKPVERTMIWSEQEACAKQVTQIGTSLCGVTAVINVMVALNLPVNLDKLKDVIGTRFRNETAPVPEYLFSRSVAGATHEDLIKGIDLITQGSLYARFFHMYPEREISLSKWLASWMKKGAIPLATVNLQRGVNSVDTIPDVWHHQMIFGVGPRGIYMTNPLECVPEKSLMVQLCSPPVLKIRRSDVTSRWTPTTDLRPLMEHPDIRWKRMNVLGQVVNVIREKAQWSRPIAFNRILTTVTSHISIPASYSSGITLVIPKENPAYELLKEAPELPILST